MTTESHPPKDYQKLYAEVFNKYVETDFNLRLCKIFIEKIEGLDFSHIGSVEVLKKAAKDFLKDINQQE